MRCGNRLRDLGKFDQEGLENNGEASFVADFLDTLDQHKSKVIKTISKKIERYGFQYFRMRDMDDEDELMTNG